MKRLRIGMVTLCHSPTFNGVVQMIALYKKGMEALGHEVTVFTLHAQPLGSNHTPANSNVVRSFGIPLAKSGYYVNFRLDKKAQQQLKQMDIVHCHHLFVAIALAHRYAHCPILYTNHTRYDLYGKNFLPFSQPIIDQIMRLAWPKACQAADHVIAPSASIEQLLHRFGVQTPITRIENGIDLRPFHSPAKPLSKSDLNVPETAVIFTYVGRLAQEKNLTTLLNQFRIVTQRTKNSFLLLIGDGPQARKLRQECRRLGIEKYVHFLGSMPNNEIPSYLAISDIFVTASRSEVHPLTLIEGMAAGLPIVAPNSPGNYDTVEDGISGILVDNEANGLANAMIELVNQPAKRRRLAEAARKSSERFSIEQTIAKTLSLYQQLLQDRPDLYRKDPHGQRSRKFWPQILLGR